MSVAILTQHFYPEIPGTAKISTDLALGFRNAGMNVVVHTGQPSFLSNDSLPSQEEYMGVTINRAYSSKISRRRQSGRALNMLIVAAITFLRLLRNPKPELILVDSTSPFLLITAWLIHKVKGIPYVFIVHDVYPEIAISIGVLKPTGLTTRGWKYVFRLIYNSAERIVVLGERMKTIVQKSVNHARWDRCIVIPNWADGEQIIPLNSKDNSMRMDLGLEDKFVVLYSGNIGRTHDIKTLIDSARALKDVDEIRFLIIGGGGRKNECEMMVRDMELNNVIFLDYQPLHRLPLSLTCGDVSIVSLNPGMEGLSVPSKLYSSLAAGLPIIAVLANNSEVGDVVENTNCGYRIEPGNTKGLVDTIITLQTNPTLMSELRSAARMSFENSYTQSMGIQKYLSLIKAVMRDN